MVKNSRKKILIITNLELDNLSDRFIVKKGSVEDIKLFKPSIIIFDYNAKEIVSKSFKNTKLIFLSNKFVFSGLNIFYDFWFSPDNLDREAQKTIDNEKHIASKKNSLIIRTDFIITKDYIKKLERSLKRRKYKFLLDDSTLLYPIYIEDFKKVLIDLIEIDAKGIIHITGQEQTTLYKIAEKLCEIKDISKRKIKKSQGKQKHIRLLGIVIPRTIEEIIKKIKEE